ncbi:MAG: hypothetical protein ACRCTT_06720 [Enterobacter roggenkampii]
MKKEVFYDGVPCKKIVTDEKGHMLLEVTKLMPWEHAPKVGFQFWVRPDDGFLNQPEVK